MTPEQIIMSEELKKLEDSVQPMIDDIRLTQTRAGTMAAVIATILGIGLPLLLQSQTKKYLHLVPLYLLIVSFFLFYITFIRSSSLKLDVLELPKEKYEKTKFERFIIWTITIKKKEPIKIEFMYEKFRLWKTATSQWGHAFFMTAIIMEIIEVSYLTHSRRGEWLHIILALVLVVIIKITTLASITSKQPTTKEK